MDKSSAPMCHTGAMERVADASNTDSIKTGGTMEDKTPHGTISGYTNHACRCADCTRANREYAREYAKRPGVKERQRERMQALRDARRAARAAREATTE